VVADVDVQEWQEEDVLEEEDVLDEDVEDVIVEDVEEEDLGGDAFLVKLKKYLP